MTEMEKLKQAEAAMRVLWWDNFVPRMVVTLGSGIGFLTELLTNARYCSYHNIPNCPIPGATGHAGELHWGLLEGVPIVMLKGRVHLYEGYTVHEVVFLTRLMIMLGAKELILTHATGAVTRNLQPGDIVGIRSQIALNCPDPTSGPGIPELGVEFSPMEEVFNSELLALAKKCALHVRIPFHYGVSAFKLGRTYESLAEIEAMARMGADVATMSTIPEITAAAQMGAKVLDLALVTDMGAGLGALTPLTHQEVLRVAEETKIPFGKLVMAIVKEMGKRE